MEHFEFKVGSATVRVHQGFPGETPRIWITNGGEDKTLIIETKDCTPPLVEVKLAD
jgi:hypothetical protein